ncbi:MAG TPA: hypothetical protein VEP90_11790, partial [Methylomirabilota bacterium]|nr:hypothetical protein [Methylomirabilota bacterium]
MLSRPEIGTQAHILLWLASEDPNEIYDWENSRECPCGRYARKFEYHQGVWSTIRVLDLGRYDECLNG